MIEFGTEAAHVPETSAVARGAVGPLPPHPQTVAIAATRNPRLGIMLSLPPIVEAVRPAARLSIYAGLTVYPTTRHPRAPSRTITTVSVTKLATADSVRYCSTTYSPAGAFGTVVVY
jgi:hypothetical protein